MSTLSGLTAAGTDTIVTMSARFLADAGIVTTFKDGALVAPDGRTFGLQNLASLCHNVAPDDWPNVIANHFGALLTAFPGDAPPPLTADQLRADTFLRLCPEMPAEMAEKYTYAPELGASTIRAVLAYKDGSMVRWLTDEDVALVGLEELRTIARRNLLNRITCDVRLEQVGDTEVTVFYGDSGFIASLALVMDALVGDRAVFFGIPNRHTLVVAPGSDDTDLAALAGWIEHEYTHGPAPVCPRVHLWDGEIIA